MPLVWSEVVAKYGNGYRVPTVAGKKFLIISHVDEEAIHIESPIWTARLQRKNLEKGVELIEAGTISRDPGLFVEDYMLYVAHERASSVCHILRDLGILDQTETFTIRC
ncbi:hypothetical protein A9Y76_10835 [Ralstonia insidiosa]|jgi:hypothetical protein|uniref:Uncharacterized protein n=2 Tax=Ralstonia TaxID=48736 RepID=A0A191ZXN3_9RALS|nr:MULTISPECIES: hypothetical protein [Ralstonia]ANJ72930.1 hypothetical protein A9Y76_10835 [Ralstonia insidiosa]EPX97119.1 hypothetical protein C404_15000 [Ralstonia sp. AU12-08]MBT2177859.1 hypothetical protein [Ralstonia pickettii]CAJ0723043.1 hypothetical protein R38712_01587 [Ralstonia pickettii]